MGLAPVVGLFMGLFAGIPLPLLDRTADVSFLAEDGSTKSCVVAVAFVLWAGGLMTTIPYFLASASFMTELRPPPFTLS